jgi:hypothetical protein
MPAAVLADLLGLHPTTAVRWMHEAGADWTRYAAELTLHPQSPAGRAASVSPAPAEVFSTAG